MWNILGQKDSRTPNERILQDEIDTLREQQEREYRHREQEAKDRRAARHEEYEYLSHQANDWPDALNKQIVLCRREVNDGGDEEIGNFFGNTILACEKALDIWQFVEAGKQAEIKKLEDKISEIKYSIREEVAKQLEASDSRSEFAQVANQIRDDQLASFLDW